MRNSVDSRSATIEFFENHNENENENGETIRQLSGEGGARRPLPQTPPC